MKGSHFGKVGIFIAGLLLLITPSIASAEYAQAAEGTPPIEQPLVREGTLALKLAPALGLPKAVSEGEAENLLGERGIMPRNGWIADYPATPDIIGELREAVGDSADAGRIPFSRAEALMRLDGVTAELAIDIRPQEEDAVISTGEDEDYGFSPTELNNYYNAVGPPVVTYYMPPVNFHYLYSWVPYPFWCGGFWFGGFYVLNDFHRTVYVGHHHHRAYVSNHYRGRGGFYRIDPVSRFNGQSGYGGHRGSNYRSNAGTATVNRVNPVPARIQGNTGSNFSSPGYQTTSGRSRMSGNWQSAPRVRGNGGTYAPLSRGDNPAVRNNTYSRGYAPSRGYNTPVRNNTVPARAYTPARSHVSNHGFSSPSRSSAPSINSNAPVRSIRSSRGFAPSGGSMRSFSGNSMSGSGFRGGGFSGGYGRR